MMEIEFSEEKYENMLAKLFVRFPSFQKDGASAYKPGIANMEFIDQLMGHPHRNYRIIHVAGTNGKGSVSNMLASSLASQGLKVGLYTSPHITDFRERMRVVEISPRTSFGRDDNSSDSQFGRDDNSVISSESERRVEKSPNKISKYCDHADNRCSVVVAAKSWDDLLGTYDLCSFAIVRIVWVE